MAKREQTVGKLSGKNKMKVYNCREARRVVLRNGFEYTHTRGDHEYFARGNCKIVLTTRNLNKLIWQRLVKEYCLDLNA